MMRLSLILIACLSGAAVGSAEEPFDAFLTAHCLRCHGPEKMERELRIDRLSRDFKSGADVHLWAEVI